jgi:hypothetical protein
MESIAIVHPGSLGMPVGGDPRACYAIWKDTKIELKRPRYDIVALWNVCVRAGSPRMS